MIYRLLVLAILAPLLLAGSAPAQSRVERQMNADIRMLQEQTQQLQLMLNTLSDAVQAVSQKLDEQANTTRKAFADQKLLSDNVAGDVREMRERLSETNTRLGTMEQEIQAIQGSIQTLRVSPPSFTGEPAADPLAGGASPAEPGASAATGTAAPPPGTSPTQTLERARTDYFSGQYSLAVQGFEAYLRWFPNLAAAAEAQYYIGESYTLDGKTKEAIAAYDKVIANYPKSEMVPSARYKRAEALRSLGQLDAAKAEYETVIKNHPNSDMARLAKQRLDGLLRPAR